MSKKRPIQPYGLIATPTPTADDLDLSMSLKELLTVAREGLEELWLERIENEPNDYLGSPAFKVAELTLQLIDHALSTQDRSGLGILDDSRLTFIIGYLYGQMTRQPPQDYWEDHEVLVEALQQRQAQARGGKAKTHFTEEKREQLRKDWESWRQNGAPGPKYRFDERMAERYNISAKLAENERLKLQKSLKGTL